METIELCIHCEEPTGRAGKADDSLYIDDDGPFCESCFDNINKRTISFIDPLRLN